MKILKILPALIAVLFSSWIGVQSQTLEDSIGFKPEAEREFVNAMKLFKAGRFDSASVLFSRVNKNYPRSHRTTGAYIMGAKSLYELKDFRESIRLLKNLVDLYPHSAYVDDAHYTLALDYFRTGRYEDAASECITVLQTSQYKQ
jgi:TolA-binding protein